MKYETLFAAFRECPLGVACGERHEIESSANGLCRSGCLSARQSRFLPFVRFFTAKHSAKVSSI